MNPTCFVYSSELLSLLSDEVLCIAETRHVHALQVQQCPRSADARYRQQRGGERGEKKYQVGGLNKERVVEGAIHLPVLLAKSRHLRILMLEWTKDWKKSGANFGGGCERERGTNLVELVIIIAQKATSDNAAKVPPRG
jgi:hypothetical protein